MLVDTAPSGLNTTPLIERHRQLQARLAPFAGWLMPISYSTIMAEHLAVRERGGLFDISHMGQLEVRGTGALAFLDRLVTRAVASLPVGQAAYTPLCHEQGGMLDDWIIYRLAPDRAFVVVNAGTAARDLEHVLTWRDRLAPGVTVATRSPERGAIAVQGPQVAPLVRQLCDAPVDHLRRYHCLEAHVASAPAVVARTGYTGEDGFEIFAPAEGIDRIWQALLEAGRALPLLPCGLGARDTLRLEAGMLLYGQDVDETRTPLEAQLDRWVDLDSDREFVGKPALLRQRASGARERLIGFRVAGRAIARHGYPVLVNGQPAGIVTSGTFAPSLKHSIGLGYVPADALARSGRLEVEIHGAPHAIQPAPLPFYRRTP